MMNETRLIGSAMQPVTSRVRAAVEPIVEGFELELVGVELGQEGHRTILWVFIDDPDGVTIADCARVAPEVSAALDVEDPVVEAYDLRVSSPGLDRPLIRATDFVRFVGREAQIQLSTPLAGRRKFTGVLDGLDGADGDAIRIICSDGEHLVPMDYIHRARLRYEVEIGKDNRR
jgi:ribosome maturation factor RimP